MYVWFACILKALSVFMGGFVSRILACAVCSQVSEFMRYPVSEGVIAHISVVVDEHASAGQVREHSAGISGRHMEAKCSGRVNVLPVRHKENSQRINVGLYDPNLSSHQSLLFGRSSQNCVAVCGWFRCDCIFADHSCVPVCLTPTELCESQHE